MAPQLEHPLFHLLLEEISFLGNTLSEHLVLGIQEFDLPSQFVLSTPCELKEKRRQLTDFGC